MCCIYLIAGISVQKYKNAIRDGTDIGFMCAPCELLNFQQARRETTAESLMNEEMSTDDAESSLRGYNTIDTTPAPRFESTRTSLLYELSTMNESMDTSEFDVTRPVRELPLEQQER